jgi:hypothetical protein
VALLEAAVEAAAGVEAACVGWLQGCVCEEDLQGGLHVGVQVVAGEAVRIEALEVCIVVKRGVEVGG